MNIIVAMKQIPDLQQIRFRDRKPVFDDVPLTFGNLDKNALEAAVELKENHDEHNVKVIAVGNEELEDTIKEALAGGADEAYLTVGEELNNLESSQSAEILAEMIKKQEDAKLILFGEGSGDNYSGQVGSRVAEILGLPQVGYASRIELEEDKAHITRSLEDSEELLEVQLPAVVSVVAGINEPRIPSVIQILKAGKKPKEVIEFDDLGLELPKTKKVATNSNLSPEMKRRLIEIKSAEELMDNLKAEGIIGR